MIVPPIAAAAAARIFLYSQLAALTVQAAIIYNAGSRPALVSPVGIGIETGMRNGLYITEDRDIMHRTTNSCIRISAVSVMIVYRSTIT